MGKRLEQIDNMPGFRGAGTRFVKRSTARARRRAAKRDPENAQRQMRYRGWVT